MASFKQVLPAEVSAAYKQAGGTPRSSSATGSTPPRPWSSGWSTRERSTATGSATGNGHRHRQAIAAFAEGELLGRWADRTEADARERQIKGG